MTVIGQMRHRLTLEMLNPSPDGAGGSENYTGVATVWGAIEPLRPNTTGRSGGLEFFYSHQITIRWRDDVDVYARLRLGARIFVIKAVLDPDETRTVLHVMAQEVKQ